MEINLKDRKVFISGVGDGIGRALALKFAEAGARVAGCARSEDRLESLVAAKFQAAGIFFIPPTSPGLRKFSQPAR